LHKHPTPGSRTGERYALTPPDPKEPLRRELPVLFQKLESLYGFSRAQLRVASISLLQEEEWGPAEPAAPARVVAKAAPPPAEVETPAAETETPPAPGGGQRSGRGVAVRPSPRERAYGDGFCRRRTPSGLRLPVTASCEPA
jgi:hypothetical protein